MRISLSRHHKNGRKEAVEKKTALDNAAAVENKPIVTSSGNTTKATRHHEPDVKIEAEAEAKMKRKSQTDGDEADDSNISVTDTAPALSGKGEYATHSTSTSISQLPQASGTMAPSPVERDQLWDEAYDNLKLDFPYIVGRYEVMLHPDVTSVVGESSVQGASTTEATKTFISQTNPRVRWQQMRRLLRRWLNNRESLYPRHTRVLLRNHIRRNLEDVMPSALAWTCVCYASRVRHVTSTSLDKHR